MAYRMIQLSSPRRRSHKSVSKESSFLTSQEAVGHVDLISFKACKILFSSSKTTVETVSWGPCVWAVVPRKTFT